jgi:Na+-transporting NADH:ubiquinone oxidoreductase subunit NqrC
VETGQFAKQNKAWWIVPLVLVLLLLAGVVVAVATGAPFIYTFF